MASRAFLAFVSLIFTAGGLVLTFFMMLAGAINHGPINKFYFLQADTSKIPGAGAISRWTFWNICSETSDGRDKCGNVHPAFPFDPPAASNFGTTKGVPTQFIGTHKFYYMSRFLYAFALIALFFASMSLLTGVLALCTRLGSRISGFLAFLALFFQTIVACLMTANFVIGRDAFRKNGQTASLGEYAMGFEWAAWACFLITTSLFCSSGGKKTKTTTAEGTEDTSYDSNRRSFFGGGRSKSQKSKVSAFDSNKEYGV